jgi:hypothetical protein
MQRMIRAGKLYRRCLRAKPLDQGYQQRRLRQGIARSLQEQHRDLHVEQMPAAILERFLGRAQWKAEERQSAYAGQGMRRLGRRCHVSAEGLAARDVQKAARAARRAASAAAARTVACASAGPSGRFEPCSMYGN